MAGVAAQETQARNTAYWSLNLFAGAGEASGSFVSVGRRSRGGSAPGVAADPERSAREAAARARKTLRRYAAHNRLTRLGTLTYAGDGQLDEVAFRLDVRRFFIALRGELGGRAFPYVWVPEWHKSHGLHGHFALGQYVKKSTIDRAWGHGFTHLKLIGDLPVGSSSWDEARAAARYLAKYVGKAIEDARIPGRHRYGCAEGFQPTVEQFRGRSVGDVLQQAAARMGGPTDYFWYSGDSQGWFGPPAFFGSWSR